MPERPILIVVATPAVRAAMVSLFDSRQADTETPDDISCLYIFEENRLRLEMLLGALKSLERDFLITANQLRAAAHEVTTKDDDESA
jgi:hypothetical protein